MGVTIRTARFSTPTSVNGNTDWTTTDLGGLTPKAVLLIANQADTDGTVEAGLSGGIGFATGTSNEASASMSSGDALETSNNDRSSNRTVLMDLIVNGVSQVACTSVSFITNGVRVNFSAVDTDAQLWTVIFFAGTDVSAHADHVTNGWTSPLDVTTPGFEPDIVFFLNTTSSAAGVAGDVHFNFGACVNDVGETQKSQNHFSVNNSGTTSVAGSFGSDDVSAPNTDGTILWTLKISDFDSNGFTLTSSSQKRDFHYLALKFAGVSSWADQFDSPTSDGDDAQTGPGFKPQFVFLGLGMNTSDDTSQTSGEGGSKGISVFDEDGNEFSNTWADEDFASTTNSESLSDNQAINLADDAGANAFAATFSTMDSTGFTLNYSNTDTTARKWFGVAVEEVAVGGGAKGPFGHPLHGPFGGPI